MANGNQFGSRMTNGVSLKGHDVKYILRRLWDYICVYKFLFLLAFALAIISNLLALYGPTLTGKALGLIGDSGGNVDFDSVFYYVSLMVIFYVISAAFSYLQAILMIHISQKIVQKMRDDAFRRLADLPVGYYDTRQTGEILSVISYDINTVNASLSHDFIQIFSSAVTIIGSLVMMLRIRADLVLVFGLTIPLSLLFTRYVTKFVRPLFRRRSAALGAMNGYAEEMIAGQKTIKAYRREREICTRFNEKNEEATTAYKRAGYFGTVTGPTVNFINNLALALVSFFGSVLFFLGNIRFEHLSSFVLYSRKFSGPINEIANIYADLQSALAAAERVFHLIDETPEKADHENAVALSRVEGRVELKNVCFGYVPGVPILKDLSFTAEPGSVTAIVGPTGAGKTTIINLLMRFYDVDSGSITIDGTPIDRIKRKSLRRAYTMVLQDTWLFGGTIFENIAYGCEGATEEQVIEAAKAAKIHGFIRRLPEGYNTILTDDGVNVSKGQKQLLTIARAMLIDSNMLILDEATSNVDSRTEESIRDAMQNLMKGKTCFVIAHRLSTIRHADCILVVRDGNVVEQGTHDALIEKNGFYAELYRSQFDRAEVEQ